MVKQQILKWKCHECGKVLQSLYEAQLNQWKESHLMVHRIKNKEEMNKYETQ